RHDGDIVCAHDPDYRVLRREPVAEDRRVVLAREGLCIQGALRGAAALQNAFSFEQCDGAAALCASQSIELTAAAEEQINHFVIEADEIRFEREQIGVRLLYFGACGAAGL